jgi:hypothetical protein
MTTDLMPVYEFVTDDPSAPAEGWMVKAVCPRLECGLLDHDESVYADVESACAATEQRRCVWCGWRLTLEDVWPVLVRRPVAPPQRSTRRK